MFLDPDFRSVLGQSLACFVTVVIGVVVDLVTDLYVDAAFVDRDDLPGGALGESCSSPASLDVVDLVSGEVAAAVSWVSASATHGPSAPSW